MFDDWMGGWVCQCVLSESPAKGLTIPGSLGSDLPLVPDCSEWELGSPSSGRNGVTQERDRELTAHTVTGGPHPGLHLFVLPFCTSF